MIAPKTRVSILDLDEQEVIQDTIENVYIRFAHLVKMDDTTNSIIDLSRKRVVISDWTGWTKLLLISKHTNDLPWYKLTASDNGTSISMTTDSNYPAYTPVLHKHGFHGEVLYKYDVLKIQSEYTIEHHIRVRGLDDEDGIIKQFSPYTIELIQQEEYGYMLYTQSSFFNANGIHLLQDNSNKEIGYK
jgi:hypothetical protein